MARKPILNSKPAPATRPAARPEAISSEVRNTAVPPRTPAPARREASYEQIAKRAYEIWQSRGGNETDNWLQAERELRSRA